MKTWKTYRLSAELSPNVVDTTPVGFLKTTDDASGAEIWCALTLAKLAEGDVSQVDFEYYVDNVHGPFIQVVRKSDKQPIFALDSVES
jgi:hypothetical protein